MKYAAYLSSAFREGLAVLQAEQGNSLELQDEILALRDIAGHALAGLDRAREDSKKPGISFEQRARLLYIASQYATEAINQVRDMAVAAQKIREGGRSINVAQMHLVMSSAMEIVDDEIRSRDIVHAHDLLGSISDRMRNELLTVDESATRTRLTAAVLDREVREMIDSVPSVPDIAKQA